MGQLTTHVLDTSGRRAGGGCADRGARPSRLRSKAAGDHDDRQGRPLRRAARRRRCVRSRGRYGLTFFVAEYFRSRGIALPEPAFIEEAVIRIGIAHAGEHYHVPLLISPWSYSVYRGG